VLTRTEGIVLKNQKHGEADLIITYLTRDRGIIKVFAKSPLKIRSRFGSALEPLTHARISFIGKEQSIPKLTQSDIIRPFSALKENYHVFVNISRLIRLMLHIIPEDIRNEKLFNFFLSALNLMESSTERYRETLYLIVLIRLLVMTGYAPRLNKCGRCGRNGINFYPEAGTILCDRCAENYYKIKKTFVRVNGSLINFYSHCIEWPMNRLSRLRPHKGLIDTLSSIIEEHLVHNIGIKP